MSPPVAGFQGLAPRIHGTHGQHAGQRGGDVRAFAAIVAGRGDDQSTPARGPVDRVGQDRVGRGRRQVLARADVDDPRPVLDRDEDRPGQVDLRADPTKRFLEPGPAGAVNVFEDRYHQASTARRHPSRRVVRRVPPEDQARHRGPVRRRRPARSGRRGHGGLDRFQARTGQGRVGPIHRAIQNGDDHPRIARGLRPEARKARDLIGHDQSSIQYLGTYWARS